MVGSVQRLLSLADNPLSYDNNGNLLYDGTESFTYDAWNRLTKVARAYRGGTNVQSGQTFATITYDGSGRRIMKAMEMTDSPQMSDTMSTFAYIIPFEFALDHL